MTMIEYNVFYTRYGVRKVEHMQTPILPALSLMELPRGSIFHYVGTNSALDAGPASDDLLFKNIQKPIYMRHIVRNGDTWGNPRMVAELPDNFLRPYHSRNRRFKRVEDLTGPLKDDQNLIVFNYAFIPRLYTYQRSIYTEYNRWHNVQAALWSTIKDLLKDNNRQHFLRCTLPVTLPSVQNLDLGKGQLTQNVAEIFDTPEEMFIREIWNWLGENRSSSLISSLTDNELNRVNLIIMESGRWSVLNLGILNSWRRATSEELKINPDANKKGVDAHQLQRYFLRLFMSLFETRTVAAPEVKEQVDIVPGEENAKQVELKTAVLNRETGKVEMKTLGDSSALTVVGANEPTDTADSIKPNPELDKKINADLAELETIARRVKGEIDAMGNVVQQAIVDEPVNLDQALIKICDRLAEDGALSGAEYLRYTKAAGTYRTLKAIDGKTTLDKFIEIPKDMLEIKESPSITDIRTVTDKTMLKSSLLTFDERYATEIIHRDVAGMVMNVQNAGVAVVGYESELVDTINGRYRDYTVKLLPVEGTLSTFRFKIPELNDDGSYEANGVKYRLRKQRGDMPIRKVSPSRVALTSYYGKTFVTRSTKRVNDYGKWLTTEIMARGLDEGDPTVKDLHPGSVFDHSFDSPRLYSTLAQSFRGFSSGGFELSFNQKLRPELYGEEAMKQYETNGSVIMGKNAKGQYLVVGKDDALYVGENGTLREAPSFESMIHLDSMKAPVEFAEVKVLGNTVPVGVILGYELGLERLMRLLNVEPRRVQAGSRLNLEPHEYALVFSDETLIFPRENRLASMVLAGFNEYKNAIRQYPVHTFDKRDVYWNVLDAYDIKTRYLREIDLMYQMFIDPITRDLLLDMKEPTDFRGLLMRSCQLLLEDKHPAELDSAYMRLKGNERIAGAVYAELVNAIRIHNGRPGKSRYPIESSPNSVWQAIAKDPSNSLLSEINPIENLKSVEAVTYSGTGGRNSRSMTKHTRAYHENDMGTISESTVDSGSVAINTFLSADPQFNSLRGTSKRYEIGKTGATALLSTSALTSVGSDRDDAKRVNFIAIQHSHGVSCVGYHQPAVRTGYEGVLAHRAGDLFAVTAKKPGKVVSVSATGYVVEYADGTTKGYEIGRRYGAAAGLTIPHSVVANVKEGQKFKEGDVLSYNEGFFEPDVLNPSNVIWKSGITVKTVLIESTQTLEDSSSISPRVAELLKTPITKVRTILVRFDQKVNMKVKEGDDVQPEDILCVIEDPVAGTSFLFDEESLDTLRALGSQTPTAKSKGKVERIEVYYHGDKDDMSDSLRSMANASDRSLSARNKSYGRTAFTGSVDSSFRIEGDPLALDRVCIKIYITGEVSAGAGDKGVFGNQMKTVFGEVLPGEIKTEDGTVIDAVFGYKSIADRIVLSPELIGTTNVLLDVIGEAFVEAYYS